MAVETEAGWIGYSGDLRFHGAQAQSTWAFAEALGELRPAALLVRRHAPDGGEPNDRDASGRTLPEGRA